MYSDFIYIKPQTESMLLFLAALKSDYSLSGIGEVGIDDYRTIS